MFLKVQGKASHAGRCYADGASAILEIAHKTLAIDTFLDLDRGLTVNTGLISGGVSANSVAPWAESRIHLTYRTLEDGQKVVAGIRDAVSRTVIPGTSASISGGCASIPSSAAKRATSSSGSSRTPGSSSACPSRASITTARPKPASVPASASPPSATWARKGNISTPSTNTLSLLPS